MGKVDRLLCHTDWCSNRPFRHYIALFVLRYNSVLFRGRDQLYMMIIPNPRENLKEDYGNMRNFLLNTMDFSVPK